MALDLEALQAAFKQTDNSGGGNNKFYQFWNMKEGQKTVIRFLPDLDQENSLGFMREKVVHKFEVNGETKVIPCLSMYGKPCPICKKSNEFYNAGDKDQGKKYWKNRTHIGQVMVVQDPLEADTETGKNLEGEYKLISLGKQIFDVLKEEMGDGACEDLPYLFSNGTDFQIKKTKQGEYASYALGTKFVNRPSDLTDDQIEKMSESMVMLKDALPKEPELEYVENMLHAALTGEISTSIDDLPAQTADTSQASADTSQPAESTPAPSKEATDNEAKSQAILDKIRQRAAAQQAE